MLDYSEKPSAAMSQPIAPRASHVRSAVNRGRVTQLRAFSRPIDVRVSTLQLSEVGKTIDVRHTSTHTDPRRPQW